ncbi:kinase-like domain-containing protein [Rhizophagus irregularis DAOM 181602=DAOM 197198]|nr:kinase-like domain-containing protein [Rhizophagus irregularis DAOM 181602=DAOM 197198]
MDTSKQNSDTTEITTRDNSKPVVKNLWKVGDGEYQFHATIFSTDSTAEDETILFFKKVNIMDLEKRKKVYGVCGECNEPGTGSRWCQPCNAKRFKENFKNWTSGNKNIDELIQQSQLNAFYCTRSLEWIPFENFENVTYLTRGGFSKIYSAGWPEGNIGHWDIENQKWKRTSRKVALKCLNNLFNNISNDFLNEIKYYISCHFHATNTVVCFGITQDPDTKDYMMVLEYFGGGNLRNILTKGLDYKTKMEFLFCIIDGLSGIHDAGNIHKDFHSGNILHDNKDDLLSIKEIPYSDNPNDNFLVVKICKGFRPKISEVTPKLIVDLIIKCWDAKAANRPTAKELRQIFFKYDLEMEDENSEISYQIKECEKIKENKLKNRTNENQSKNHPQAIYTSRLLNFENLPEPVNSTDYLSSFQETISSSANPIFECLDCELNELDLNQDDDE